MKLNFIKNKNQKLSVLLFGFSMVFGILIIVKISTLLITSVRAERLMKKAAAQSVYDPNEAKKQFKAYRDFANEIKENNLFVPKKPKQNPAKNITGILGREILINDRWYKVGDKVGDAEILAVEPTRVKVRWKDKEEYFSPLGAVTAAAPRQMTKGSLIKKSEKNSRIATPQNRTIDQQAVIVQQQNDPLAWLGVDIPEHLRAKFLEKWNSLSDEEKEQAKEQWNSLSDDQKQQAVQAW